MFHSLLSAVLLLGMTLVRAGEVQHARVDHQDGDYSVDISVKVSGERDTIYNIATDYKQLARLSDLIVESGLVTRVDPGGTTVVRRRLVTRTCVLYYCFNATLVEDVWEPVSGIIRTVFVPEESDFLYGEAIWRVLKIDDTHTLITFHSKFRPDFWVPPLIGPLVIKRMMLNAAEQTIENIETIAGSEQFRS
jgi:hypothetical protein